MTWYKTGTVNATQGSNAILGTGTAFISNSRVGDAFRGPDGEWYEVINIASDTAMSISPNYQGVSTVSDDYSVAPMQGYVKDTADALRAASLVIGASATDMSAQLEIGKGYAERSEAAATSVVNIEGVVQGLATQVSADTVTTTNNTALAQNSATAANAVAGRFLLPKTSLPTTRDNGDALEVGDRVLLSTTGYEYIYKDSGWVVNNVDGQELSGAGGAGMVGAVLPNGETGTVQSAIQSMSTSNVVVVASVQQLLLAQQDVTRLVRTQSWYAGLNKGGLSYSWSPTTPKNRHNGGTTISPTVPYNEGDLLNDFLTGVGESQPSGQGCWLADTYGLKYSVLCFGAKGDGVLGDGLAGVNDGFAINTALLSASMQGAGRVYLGGTHRSRQSVVVPSYVTLAATPLDGLQVATDWFGGSLGRKAIINADTTNGNTACGVDNVTIRGLPGSEFDHGIHFCKTEAAVINTPDIADVSGDAICLGNITGGVHGLCVGTTVNNPKIRRVGRMAIAMTCARGTRINGYDIADLTGAITNAGVGLDFEPDEMGDECTDNIAIGGTMYNVKEGVTMASVAALTEELTKGNKVIGGSIDTTQGDGIRCSYSNSLVEGMTLKNIGKIGINIQSGDDVQGTAVVNNDVISCSLSNPGAYDAYYMSSTAHCVLTGNISRATQARYSLHTVNSAQNNIANNNWRASGRPSVLSEEDAKSASHNIEAGAVGDNIHAGFKVSGPIDMGYQSLILGGVPIIVVTDAPSDSTGAEGSVAFNAGARVGTSLWYKKVSGSWRLASPVIT